MRSGASAERTSEGTAPTNTGDRVSRGSTRGDSAARFEGSSFSTADAATSIINSMAGEGRGVVTRPQPQLVASTSYMSFDGYGAGPGNRLIPVNNPSNARSLSAEEATNALADAYGYRSPEQRSAFRQQVSFSERMPVMNLPQGSYMPVHIAPQLDSQLRSVGAQQQAAAQQRQQQASQLSSQVTSSLGDGEYYADRNALANSLHSAGVPADQIQSLVRRNDQNVNGYLSGVTNTLRDANGGYYDDLSQRLPPLVQSGYITQRDAQGMLDRNWLRATENTLRTNPQRAPSYQEINNRGYEMLQRGTASEAEVQALKDLARPPSSQARTDSLGLPTVQSPNVSNEEFSRNALATLRNNGLVDTPYSDPNQPRFEQAPPETLFSSASNTARDFWRGLVQGRPSNAGGLGPDMNQITEDQANYAGGMSRAEILGASARDVGNFLPFGGTILEGLATERLARNPHEAAIYGRDATGAAISFGINTAMDILPIVGAATVRVRPPADVPTGAVRPDVPTGSVDAPSTARPAQNAAPDEAVVRRTSTQQTDSSPAARSTEQPSVARQEPAAVNARVMTPEEADVALDTLRQGGSVSHVDPLFQDIRANGLGRPGEYNMEGARTVRDVAERNSNLPTTDGAPTTHDISHSTLAGAGGQLNNSVYPDGINGILVAGDNLAMKDFMQRYDGDVSRIDIEALAQRQIDSQIRSDTRKFQYALRTMDDNMGRLLPQAGDDPALRQRTIEQVVNGTRNLVESSQEYGFLNFRNYQPGNTPTPQSESIRQAVDSAWDNITTGYMNNDRQLVQQGLNELNHLQKRELIANTIPRNEAVDLFKDHITYHELLADRYVAQHGGTRADYYTQLGDKFNTRNPILDLEVPTRDEFIRRRQELFPSN